MQVFSDAQTEFQDLQKMFLYICLVTCKGCEIHLCKEVITVPLVIVNRTKLEYSKTFLFSVMHNTIFLCT